MEDITLPDGLSKAVAWGVGSRKTKRSIVAEGYVDDQEWAVVRRGKFYIPIADGVLWLSERTTNQEIAAYRARSKAAHLVMKWYHEITK